MAESFFRTATIDLKQYHVSVITEKKENGDLIIPIPEEIMMAYGIEVGDAAVFEIVDRRTLLVRFVRKGQWSVTEKYGKGMKKDEIGRSVKQIEKRKK